MSDLKAAVKSGKKKVRHLRTRLKANLFSLLNSRIPPRGVNLGGGSWRKLGWVNYDARHEQDLKNSATLGPDSKLDFKDASMRYVFSSHFFEHIDDATAQNLINESYRILKPGGILRILVPDFELAMERFRKEDHAFFDSEWGMEPRYENWLAMGVPATLENKLSYAFFSFSNMDDKGLFPAWKHIPGYYCGPLDLPQQTVRENALRLGIHDFSDWLLSLKPGNAFDLGHINVYDNEKFTRMFKQAGFSNSGVSRFRRSKSIEMQGLEFDNRPEWSLFVEAIK